MVHCYIEIDRRLSVTSLSSENNFADVLTECSSCHQGESERSTWEHHHPIYWEETTVLDHGRGQELLVKEALHIQMTPVEEHFNQDGGLEVPGCWTL